MGSGQNDKKVRRTPLRAALNVGKRFGTVHFYIKDESVNPSGTWKDRRSALVMKQVRRQKKHTLMLITSGNAGYSLANMSPRRMHVVCVVDRHLKKNILGALEEVCRVIQTDLSKHVFHSKDVLALMDTASKGDACDVTNGYHAAYESIASELVGLDPDYIVVPVGSGESFVGIYNGLKRRHMKAALIGVRPRARNSIADKLVTPWTPYANKIKMITRRKHKIMAVSEQQIRQGFGYAKRHMRCEPSSAIVFAALAKIQFKKTDVVVIVNSGKGLV